MSFLPENAIKVKVYVPETALSSLTLGQTLGVHCDGCEKGLTVAITYIAREPEFTPPVIYSLESRQTLVYLIEARAVNDKPLGCSRGRSSTSICRSQTGGHERHRRQEPDQALRRRRWSTISR